MPPLQCFFRFLHAEVAVNLTMKAAQQFPEKNIAVEHTAILMVLNAILHVIKKMKNLFNTIILIISGFMSFGAVAQEFQNCKATNNELKLYSRTELLAYVCEAKKLVNSAQSKLVQMQINLSEQGKISDNVNPENFSRLKLLADDKDICIESISKAFYELKKYGLHNGHVDDDVDYCKN